MQVSGMLSTMFTPSLISWCGLELTLMLSQIWQWFFISIVTFAGFNYFSTSWGAFLMLGGICVSRIGLWTLGVC